MASNTSYQSDEDVVQTSMTELMILLLFMGLIFMADKFNTSKSATPSYPFELYIPDPIGPLHYFIDAISIYYRDENEVDSGNFQRPYMEMLDPHSFANKYPNIITEPHTPRGSLFPPQPDYDLPYVFGETVLDDNEEDPNDEEPPQGETQPDESTAESDQVIITLDSIKILFDLSKSLDDTEQIKTFMSTQLDLIIDIISENKDKIGLIEVIGHADPKEHAPHKQSNLDMALIQTYFAVRSATQEQYEALHTDTPKVADIENYTNRIYEILGTRRGNNDKIFVADNAGLAMMRAVFIAAILDVALEKNNMNLTVLPYSAAHLIDDNVLDMSGTNSQEDPSRRRVEIRLLGKLPTQE